MVFRILSKTKNVSEAERNYFYNNRRIRGHQSCFCGNEKRCLKMFKASIDAKDDKFCVIITVGGKSKEDKKVQKEIRSNFQHLDIAKGAIFIRGHHIKDEHMKNQTEGLSDLNVTSLLSFEEMEQRYRKERGVKHNGANITMTSSSPQSKKEDIANQNRVVLSPIPTNYNIIPNGKRAPSSSGRKGNDRKRWQQYDDNIDGDSVTRNSMEMCESPMKSKVLSYENESSGASGGLLFTNDIARSAGVLPSIDEDEALLNKRKNDVSTSVAQDLGNLRHESVDDINDEFSSADEYSSAIDEIDETSHTTHHHENVDDRVAGITTQHSVATDEDSSSHSVHCESEYVGGVGEISDEYSLGIDEASAIDEIDESSSHITHHYESEDGTVDGITAQHSLATDKDASGHSVYRESEDVRQVGEISAEYSLEINEDDASHNSISHRISTSPVVLDTRMQGAPRRVSTSPSQDSNAGDITFTRVNGVVLKGASRNNSLGNRDVEWKLCNRPYTLPINYRPVLSTEYEMLVNEYNEGQSIKQDLKSCQEKLELLSRQKANSDSKISSEAKATEIGKCLLRTTEKVRCPASRLGKHMYSYSLSVAPKLSVDALSQIAPLIVSAWLADADILEKLDDPTCIANTTPSPNYIHKSLELSEDQIMMKIGKIVNEGIPTSSQQDKGERAGNGHLVSELAWFWDAFDGVDQQRMSADGSGSTDVEVAEALDLSFSKVDDFLEKLERLRLSGSSTDQGGGGVGDSVMAELAKLDRKALICYVNACFMHIFSRSFQVAFEESLGKGGLGQDNILQFLHTCWSVQTSLGEKFKPAWKLLLNLADEVSEEDDIDEIEKLIKPILTRWGYVLKAAEGVLGEWDGWKSFLSKVFELIDTKEKDMSQQCVELMNNPKLKCEIEFVVAFGEVYWKKHFAWLHRTDEKTKRSGFCAHEMVPRMAAMKSEFSAIAEKWKEMPEFEAFRKSLSLLDKDSKDENGKLLWAGIETTNEQIDLFFKRFGEVFHKNDEIWRVNSFVFAAASSNQAVATSFAKWYLGTVTQEMREDDTDIFLNCNVHKDSKLSMREWIEFLDTCSKLRTDPILARNMGALQQIADGSYLYATDASDMMKKFLYDVKHYWFIQAHITQSTERGVQDMSICVANRKGERDATALVMLRSANLGPVFAKLRESQATKRKKANQHMSGGVDGERVLRSDAAIRNNEKRKKNGMSENRARVLPCVETSKAHIQKAIDGCITPEELNRIKEVKVERRDKPRHKNAKAMRVQQFTKKIIDNSNNTRRKRNANNLKARAMTVPNRLKKIISITSFGKKITRPYLEKELIARGISLQEMENKNVTTLKTMLARQELIRRGMEREEVKDMEWKILKNRLSEGTMGTDINLLDEKNKEELSIILDLANKQNNK